MTETELDELRSDWFRKGWMSALKEVIFIDEYDNDVISFAKEQVEHLGNS